MESLRQPRTLIGIVVVLVLVGLLFSGCNVSRMPMLNPVGYVTHTVYELLIVATIIMLAIIVPIMIATLWVAKRYRDSENHEGFDPNFDNNVMLDKVTHYVPLLTIVLLGVLNWVYTHKLDPYRPLPGPQPYEIQAVSLDYKWLFIYPESGVATVNEMAAPVGRPVTIRITSDPMMTSIFIPNLINQIYAMTGMETRANFLAPKAAVLDGANAMYSGPEFFAQRFKVELLPEDKFAAWLKDAGGDKAKVKTEPMLDMARYTELAKRSKGYPVTYFAKVEPRLFETIVRQYQPSYHMNPLPAAKAQSGASASAQSHEKQGH
ncbi:MAG: COX aromatic rich motif-containing protein [Hyphomicrobiaceae bacterium]